jgi:glycosyltransferase involved in cell wall biosynthesis
MRIAVVTTSFPAGDDDPAGHFVQSEARALAHAGHEVTVIAPRPMPGPTQGGTTTKVPRLAICWLDAGAAFGWPGALARLRQSPWNALGMARFVLAARKRLEGGGFDRVVAHWLVPCGWPIATISGLPCEVVIHGSDARLFLSLPALVRRALLGALLRRRTQFRFVSEHLHRAFTALEPRLSIRSHVAPCGVDVPALDRGTLRSQLGVPPGAQVAIVVGRLVESKRVARALTLTSLPPDTLWFVVGDGPERAGLERRFPHVRFLGQLARRRTLEWIASADVLVSASLAEGAPTVIREARALGTRVITPSVGDVEAWAAADPGIQITPALAAG